MESPKGRKEFFIRRTDAVWKDAMRKPEVHRVQELTDHGKLLGEWMVERGNATRGQPDKSISGPRSGVNASHEDAMKRWRKAACNEIEAGGKPKAGDSSPMLTA